MADLMLLRRWRDWDNIYKTLAVQKSKIPINKSRGNVVITDLVYESKGGPSGSFITAWRRSGEEDKN